MRFFQVPILFIGFIISSCSFSKSINCELKLGSYDKSYDADKALCKLSAKEKSEKAKDLLKETTQSIDIYYKNLGSQEAVKKEASNIYDKYLQSRNVLKENYRNWQKLNDLLVAYKELYNRGLDKLITEVFLQNRALYDHEWYQYHYNRKIDAKYYSKKSYNQFDQLLESEFGIRDAYDINNWIQYVKNTTEIVLIKDEIQSSIDLLNSYANKIQDHSMQIEANILQKRGVPKSVKCFPGSLAISDAIMSNRLSYFLKNSCHQIGYLQVVQVLHNGFLAKLPDFYTNVYMGGDIVFIYTKNKNLIDGQIINGILVYAVEPFSYHSLLGKRTVASFKEINMDGIYFLAPFVNQNLGTVY